MKRKFSMFVVMDDGDKATAASIKESIENLSNALVISGAIVANNKYDHAWNAKLYADLDVIRLDYQILWSFSVFHIIGVPRY